MSKLTTFQELRHKCAKLYCPKDWTTNLWTDFFGDCIKITAFSEAEQAEAIDEVSKCYNIEPEIITNVITFINENVIENV